MNGMPHIEDIAVDDGSLESQLAGATTAPATTASGGTEPCDHAPVHDPEQRASLEQFGEMFRCPTCWGWDQPRTAARSS